MADQFTEETSVLQLKLTFMIPDLYHKMADQFGAELESRLGHPDRGMYKRGVEIAPSFHTGLTLLRLGGCTGA